MYYVFSVQNVLQNVCYLFSIFKRWGWRGVYVCVVSTNKLVATCFDPLCEKNTFFCISIHLFLWSVNLPGLFCPGLFELHLHSILNFLVGYVAVGAFACPRSIPVDL